ncbi:MAG TPA: 50S ribosomal protein L4 [Solirubrobacteraceae bacterium]|nr:50S ribosomal protein L4 [Solirubrobacteraceae bacterium]
MASAPYLNKSGTADLDDAAFGADWNGPLVHEAVRAELNARRRGTAATKTRGEVRGGGAKPWRQKGTGRARAGSTRSPIWTGGGTVFGPSPRSYTVKVNRKARRAALRAALSLHAGRSSLAVLDAGSFEAPRTKDAAGALAQTALPALVVVEDGAALKSFRNIDGVDVRTPQDVGIADVVRAASLVLSDAAVEHLTALATRTPREANA